jgi:hypothetical protein
MSESQGGAGDGGKKPGGGRKGGAKKGAKESAKAGGKPDTAKSEAKPSAAKPSAAKPSAAKPSAGLNAGQPTSIESFITEPPPGIPTSDTPWRPADELPPAADASRGAPPNTTLTPGVGGSGTTSSPSASNERAEVPRIVHASPAGAPAIGSSGAPLRVGLVVGREWSFPPKFIDAVDSRDQGVTAELVKLGDEHMDDPCDYALIVDRISHEVPFYRTYLKHAVLQGTTVVNNPFMWSADDKFFGASLITKLGVASPKTVVLPNKQYIPGIVPSESLRNLKFPIDWTALAEYVGMPCILKDAHGGGWKEVYVCRSLDELLHHYDSSGLLTMIVQEFIEWDQFVRCLCIGQEDILPMKYDPGERRYLVEHDHLDAALGDRIVKDAKTIVRALGYDMNSIEFAVRGGVPYAIDFMNPAPDMDIYSLTPHYFEWAVEHMANMAIRLAKHPRQQAGELGWASLFKAGRAR